MPLWGIGELKLRLRTRLTQHLYDEYLKGFTYYKMANLDSRIANADQLLTTDVQKFCDMFADLYSNICKPMLDIVIYVYQLTSHLGGTTPSVMIAYLLVAGTFLTWLRRPAGRMTVTEQKLEGEFRYINSRLIANSEEIAFYNGNNREKLTVLAAFQKLTNHLRKFLEFRAFMGTIDNIIAKYFATVVGFIAVSLPFLSSTGWLAASSKDQRFKQYYSSGRMLVKLAEAIGRLVLAGREMTGLAGFTARVTELMVVLKDINQGHYQRTMINDKSKENNSIEPATLKPKIPLIPGAGRIIYQDNIIRFNRVPLVTPNGDILVDDLTFEVKSGMNVLVCGPNGCGKSSLFRILGELWPLFGGTVTKPPRGKLFYIPQRPYMTLGTLRDQVIYPHTREEMVRRGKSDVVLAEHLERVQLTYLLQREQGWDTIADWIDVLSGGEKQRIACKEGVLENSPASDNCKFGRFSLVMGHVEDSSKTPPPGIALGFPLHPNNQFKMDQSCDDQPSKVVRYSCLHILNHTNVQKSSYSRGHESVQLAATNRMDRPAQRCHTTPQFSPVAANTDHCHCCTVQTSN
ncbi:ATP-binding cassette sub- D member 3 [Homalodisca vitripennis]|nr:ATP-binding cassette sub- D member 3 [Homalodisca vitripennis]